MLVNIRYENEAPTANKLRRITVVYRCVQTILGMMKEFHRFPCDTKLRKEWIAKIRRDIGQNFQVIL